MDLETFRVVNIGLNPYRQFTTYEWMFQNSFLHLDFAFQNIFFYLSHLIYGG